MEGEPSGGRLADSSRGTAALEAFLSANDGSAAEAALSTLLCTHAMPLIRRVLRSKTARAGEDVQDLVQGVLVRLVARLRSFRSRTGGTGRIEAFDSYVAAIAHRVHAEDLRVRHPGRRRLRRWLQSALRQDSRFSLREDSRGQWLCGLASEPTSSAPKRLASAAPELPRLLAGRPHRSPAEHLADLHAALATLGRPVKLDAIVNALSDPRPGATDVPATVASPEAQVADRQLLRRLWTEIRLLPAAQRRALLLNLSDPQGRDLIALLPLTGTASMREIAGALEMPPEDLAGLWHRLPLDDRAIGLRLGLSRQQVINLRSAARRRLARRLRVGR